MGSVQRAGQLHADAQHVVNRQRPAPQAPRQRLAGQIFHDQEIDAVLVADVIQRADVRMGQPRDRAGLALESLASIGVGADVGG